MTANASVPRGDTLTRAPGAAEAAKKMRCRRTKSRWLASRLGNCLPMAGTSNKSRAPGVKHARSSLPRERRNAASLCFQPSLWSSARIGERVPAPCEQRQRIAREGAEVVGQRRRDDRTRCDGLKADQALEADCRGDLGIVDGLEAARGALERILVRQPEAGLRELRRHRLERPGRTGRGGPQPAELSRIGQVEAGGEEALFGRQVEVEDAGIAFPPRPGQRNAGVGLVRVLVQGETHVAVDAECGRLAVAPEWDFRMSEPLCDILEQVCHRPLRGALVSGAVRLEPLPALMELERLEEWQRLGAEALEGHFVTLQPRQARPAGAGPPPAQSRRWTGGTSG